MIIAVIFLLALQAFSNLVGNAVKYTPDNGRINIDAHVLPTTLDDEAFIEIVVADTGIGIPEENLKKIFDSFFTTKDDGSGIGLNIAQRIVADHNGTLSLGTSRWGGAEFKIKLPIERRIDAR